MNEFLKSANLPLLDMHHFTCVFFLIRQHRHVVVWGVSHLYLRINLFINIK